MGLDITAYQNIRFIDCVFDASGEPIDPGTRKPIDEARRVNVNRDFVARADGLQEDAWFVPEKAYGFHAGSYGGYNQWREELAKLSEYPAVETDSELRRGKIRHDAGAWKAESGPFWELINFSDCEGCIGPKTSAKLAKDFADYQQRADSHSDERFRDRYNEWRGAFEMAAINGLVDFH